MRTFTAAGLRVVIDEDSGVGGLLLPDPAHDMPDPLDSGTLHQATVDEAIRQVHAQGLVLDTDDDGAWLYLDREETVLSLWSVLDGASGIDLEGLEEGRVRVLEALNVA